MRKFQSTFRFILANCQYPHCSNKVSRKIFKMKRNPVKTLKYFCLANIGPNLTKHIRKLVSKASCATWYGLLHGETDWDADEVIQKQIKLLKQHIWSHIIWYDYYEFFKILVKSINDGVAITRKSWKPSSNLTVFKQEIEHIVLFIDVAINPDMLALGCNHLLL